MKMIKDNRGISLVEILVTIVIVAIIAVPLVNSFVNAIGTNSRAMTIQNGTAVAKDTAEVFKAAPVEKLVSDYETKAKEIIKSADGRVKFVDIPVSGADGEDFLVTVTLDPTIYAECEGEESVKLAVNNVDLPVFSGLFGSDSVMLYRQYSGYDDQMYNLFKDIIDLREDKDGDGEYDTIPGDLNGDGKLDDEDVEILAEKFKDDEVKAKFSKATKICVNCTYDESLEAYSYKFDLYITYEYDKDKNVHVTRSLQKVYKGDQIHSVYLIAPIFDVYSHGHGGMDFFYNTDSIEVVYNYVGNEEYKKNLYFYIAEQQASNQGYDSTKAERIDPRNILVNGVAYPDYNMDISDIKVYTNIGDKDNTFTSEYGLTHGEHNSGNALYQLDIEVEYDGEDVASFSTTR